MAHTTLKNGSVISLDSVSDQIIELNKTLLNQITIMDDQISRQEQIVGQLKVANIYKSYETDIVIDEKIFDTEEDN
jgi:methanogenic corrinoid protein MtbC1